MKYVQRGSQKNYAKQKWLEWRRRQAKRIKKKLLQMLEKAAPGYEKS